METLVEFFMETLVEVEGLFLSFTHKLAVWANRAKLFFPIFLLNFFIDKVPLLIC